MNPIAAPVVHNLNQDKGQITLKLNNKIIRSATKCHIYCLCLSDFADTYSLRDGANPSSRRRLHTKVKMANCVFGDQDRKQCFQLVEI